LPVERAWVDKVIANDYSDIYRTLNPTKNDVYTYWDQKSRARDRNVGWRIDYWFVSNSLLPQVVGLNIKGEVLGSDHCPVELEINL